MDVLQVIHTNSGESRGVNFIKSPPPCSQQRTSIVVIDDDSNSSSSSDSDDDEKLEQKRNQFGNHVASFCFKANSKTFLSLLSSVNKESSPTVLPSKSVDSISSNLKQMPTLKGDTISDQSCSVTKIEEELPQFPDSLEPTLRSFLNCPICLQPFPILPTLEEEMKCKTGKRKAKSSKVIRKAMTGAARLTHLQMCSFKRGISTEVVISLIGRERIRLDRNQREEYNEEINNQRLWKTLTGDAPPSTQAQQNAIKGRKKWKGKATAVEVAAAKQLTKKQKATTTPTSFKAGKRGGLNRATTLILAPRLARSLAKKRCIELFGEPDEVMKEDVDGKDKGFFGHHEERTLRCQRAASQVQLVIGLGVGACSPNREEDAKGSIARLGMGFSMGSSIAQRFRPRD